MSVDNYALAGGGGGVFGKYGYFFVFFLLRFCFIENITGRLYNIQNSKLCLMFSLSYSGCQVKMTSSCYATSQHSQEHLAALI